MTGAEKIGKLAIDLADAAMAATARGDDVRAVFFAIKAHECLAIAKELGWIPAGISIRLDTMPNTKIPQ